MRVNKIALYGALQILNKATDSKSTVSALQHIKLVAKNGILNLTATDLDRTLSTTIPAQDDLETPLPCKVLMNLAKPESKKDNGTVTIEPYNEQTVSVIVDGLQTKLSTIPVEDFPVNKRQDWSFIGMLDAKTLKGALTHTVPAMCKDETRPHICCLAFTEDKIVSTDGHRLHLGKLDSPIDEPFLIPGDTAKLLQRIVDFTGLVTIEKSAAHARITAGVWTLVTKTLDAQFPPYEQVMPRSNPIQVSLPADALTKAIKRIATLSPNKGIQVVVNGIVTLSASNPELGEASVEVEPITSNHEGEDLILGLNTTYMLDAIGKKKKTVQMSMAGPLDPVRIDLNDGFTSVLMPMRI